jgi:hypothetical protein
MMMSLPNQQGVKTVSVMGKAGGSQLLNTTTGQILALPGNTQTMMIGTVGYIFNILMVMGKAGGSQLLNTTK